MKKIAVIGKSQSLFESFRSFMDDADRQKFQFVCSADGVRGCKFAEVISIGDYWNMNNYPEILDAVNRRIAS